MADEHATGEAVRTYEHPQAEVQRLRAELAAAEAALAARTGHTPRPGDPTTGDHLPQPEPRRLEAVREHDGDTATVLAAPFGGPPSVGEQASAWLVVGNMGITRWVPIPGLTTVIGSDDTYDLVVRDRASVQPQHATVWLQDDDVVLRSLAPGGVTVNGRAMTWACLDHGDVLDFDGFQLRVVIPGAGNEHSSIAV